MYRSSFVKSFIFNVYLLLGETHEYACKINSIINTFSSSSTSEIKRTFCCSLMSMRVLITVVT